MNFIFLRDCVLYFIIELSFIGGNYLVLKLDYDNVNDYIK